MYASTGRHYDLRGSNHDANPSRQTFYLSRNRVNEVAMVAVFLNRESRMTDFCANSAALIPGKCVLRFT